MVMHRLERRQSIPGSLERVWAYFATPQNLNVLTPPALRFEIIQGAGEAMYPGQLLEYRLRFAPLLRSTWLTEITHVEERKYFIDVQRFGPYRFWHHEHRFVEADGAVEMTDRVTYALPFGLLGEVVHAAWVRSKLEHIFDFRKKKVAELFGAG